MSSAGKRRKMDLMEAEKRRIPGDWSKLPKDILRNIFESYLSPLDFHLAKSVCSWWYSVSQTCVNIPPCPLRIIHQGVSSTFPGPQPQKSLHGSSYCMASSENWLFMVSSRLAFYLENLFTRERINLPSLDSLIRERNYLFSDAFRRKDYISEDTIQWKSSALLWMDDTTGDYLAAWVFRQHYLLLYKRGDASWSSLDPKDSGFRDVAYKNNKLYVLTTDNTIRIFCLSQGFRREERFENPYRNHPFQFDEQQWEYVWKRKIAINKCGEVLIILSLKEVRHQERLLFYIFRMNLGSCKWERVYSLGDQMVIFGRGVTVRAPVKDIGDGIKRDSIYFVEDDVWPDHQDYESRGSNCGVFDIATSRIQWPKKVCYYINNTQWFVPGVAY